MLTDVIRWGFHVQEDGKVGVNVLGDEQVLWEHVAVKFEVHTRNSQTPDSRHWTLEIPNPRFSEPSNNPRPTCARTFFLPVFAYPFLSSSFEYATQIDAFSHAYQ